MLNLEIGDDESGVSMDVLMDETVLSEERVDRVERDHLDAIVESVLDTEGVEKTIAVSDTC